MASEFDRVHSVQRALGVGALNQIVPSTNLRPYLVHAIERGIERLKKVDSKIEERETPTGQTVDDFALPVAS